MRSLPLNGKRYSNNTSLLEPLPLASGGEAVEQALQGGAKEHLR